MKQNLITLDRVIRFGLAAGLGYLYFSRTVTGAWGIILLTLAVILLVTSIIGYCPIYALFHIGTKKTRHQAGMM